MLTTLTAALAALLMAACGTAPAADDPGPGGDPNPSLAWTVDDCDGDAPMLCVYDGDRVVGTIEYLEYLADGDSDLAGRIADYYATFEADRGDLYGEDHEFIAFDPTPATVAGIEGLRYGFSVTAPDGSEVERQIAFMALRDDAIHVVAASATLEDSEYVDFTPTELRLFEERFAALVADRPLPERPADDRVALLGDGDHLGYLRSIDLDMGVVMLDVVEWVEAPGETPEWRIDDPDDTHYVGRLSGDVSVTIIDCTQECEPAGTTIGELAGGAVTPFNGEHALFDVVVSDGLVQSIEERYVP